MKTLTRITLVLLSLVIGVMSGAAQPAARVQQRSIVFSNNVELVIEGKVINVHDGDTITVLDKDNKKTHIRLQGIDAPELKQEYGSVSQENLARMVMGKQVTIVWTKVDKYRRTVGTIMLNGHDMNIEQVKAGLAWHFKKYEDEQKPEDRRTYAAAEQEARAARLGLWKDPNPTPPGDWRLDVKTARWGAAPPEGTIVGNKNSKKYHRPDCPGYRDMAERNRVFFKSVADAEAAGYKRAGNCPAEIKAVVVKPAISDPLVKPVPIPTNPSPQTPAVTPVSLDSKILTANRSSAGKIIGNKNSKIYHVPNKPVNTSTSTDAEKGVFHDDKAGIRLKAPDGWTTKLNGEQLTMSPPDDSMKIITWVPEGDFQEAIKDLEHKLSQRIQHMKTNKDGTENSINGMPTYTVAGTGQIDQEDIEWSVDIIKAPKRPVIVLSFAKAGAWEKHQDDIKQLVSSIKPTS